MNVVKAMKHMIIVYKLFTQSFYCVIIEKIATQLNNGIAIATSH